jgi:hypothetical protein
MKTEIFDFKKWNTITGWCVFVIALITYTLTVEPTMSFWDCGEYIATAAKLEVGHPPGAPLFQMMGAFFAMFAIDKEHIALMVNMMSVFSSAFTILFLFWSSTLILRKLIGGFADLNKNNEIVILGAAAVGALAFTFSDSFWFNAVEAEVYAMATLFISMLFWLGLRWEQDMHEPRGDRWLLIISLVIGLSFGVHFMALLTIPSIGLLYYFKNYKTITIKNFIIANIVVVCVLLFIFKLLLPLTMSIFAKSEVFIVNSFGLPFNSGTIFAALLLVASFYFGLKYTTNKGYVKLNTGLLCILFILIGFSTWLMLPIRANANTVINENKPSDASEVLAYYNREQYGENPLFYGPQFTDLFAGLDEETPYLDDKINYERDEKSGQYIIVNNYKNAKQNSASSQKAFLPRLWSTDNAANYISFTNPLEFRIDPDYDYDSELADYGVDISKLTDEQHEEATQEIKKQLAQTISEFRLAYKKGELDNDDYIKFLKSYKDYLIIDKPTTIDNIGFMFNYQFGYMYVRYFLWNFVGRQNDIQGHGDNQDGNWLSGINFMDCLRLGSQTDLPADMKNNKGRNTYFYLPLLIGLLGIFYHAKKDLKSFYVLLVLFLFTGLVLKIYLNERPFEPRERDYALVGSFYIFAIWIGFGVYAIYENIKNYLNPKTAGFISIGACLLAAPVLMGSKNWDDHDRSHKRTAVALAKAYLDSCDKNAILYTIGDNDTFPLWYVQEIEGYRTDVKLVNTSLFMTHWYIDQMKMKSYESEGLPISFTHDQYVGDKLDYIVERKTTEERLDIKQFIEFVKLNDERAMVALQNGQQYHCYPTDKIRIPVDKATIIANKVVPAKDYDSIVPYIDIDFKERGIYKNRLMMLDIMANNNWKRPIYFSGGAFGDDDYIWMKDYLQLDGMVYKLVPIKTPMKKDDGPTDMGRIDADKMYQNIMKWDWGNSESPLIYHDPETRRESISYRSCLSRLMNKLIDEGKNDKAKKVIDLAITKMPIDYFGYYTSLETFAKGYYKINETKKAQDLILQLIAKYKDELKYYNSMKPSEQMGVSLDIQRALVFYKSLLEVAKDNNDLAFYDKQKAIFDNYKPLMQRFRIEDDL